MQDETPTERPETPEQNGAYPPLSTDQQPTNVEQPVPEQPPLAQQTNLPDQANQPEQPYVANNPFAQSTAQMPQPAPVSAPKKSKKKWIILASIIAVLVLLGAGAFATYAWYQNPNKVLSDAAVNVATAQAATVDGKLVYKNSGTTLTATLGTKSDGTNSSTSADITIKSETTSGILAAGEFHVTADAVVASKDAIYFKLGDLKKVTESIVNSYVDSYTRALAPYGEPMSPAEISKIKKETLETIAPTIAKIDGQWIKVSYKDIDKQTTDENASTQCAVDGVDKLRTDDAMQTELKDVYAKNAFINIDEELGVQNGSLGYAISLDADKFNSFAKASNDTALGKELGKCAKDGKLFDENDAVSANKDAINNTRIEMWVSQWTHQLTAMKIHDSADKASSDGTLAMDLNFDFTAKPTVEIPSSAKSFEDLQSDLSGLTGGL